MMQSDGTITTSGCRRPPGLPASQTDSAIEASQDAEVTSTSTNSVPAEPSTLIQASIAAAEGGYMNGKSRRVSGRG